MKTENKTWTAWFFEERESSVRYFTNASAIIEADTREEALEKANSMERDDFTLCGVSLVPTSEYNAINSFNWKWK